MGANEMRVVVGRMKARNDEHAQKEGLKESESLKVAHSRRAKLREAAIKLGAVRQRIDRHGVMPGTVAELAEVLDVVLKELLASGALS